MSHTYPQKTTRNANESERKFKKIFQNLYSKVNPRHESSKVKAIATCGATCKTCLAF